MVRTQIALDGEDHRRAKRRAAELDVSLAEYIRRLVARDLGAPQPAADVSGLFGIVQGSGSDIARHKDDYVGEAVEAEHANSGTPRG